MAATARKERIRESWQRGGLEGTSAKVWLIVRRTAATLLGVALIGLCVYLLWTFLRNPKTYFVHLTATAYRPSGGQPLQFAYGDFAAFNRLAAAVEDGAFPETLERPLTRRFFLQKLQAVSTPDIRSKDTLIVYLAAHGVMREREPYLRFEADEFVRLWDVLGALKASPAGTKLLILDAGQDSYNPRTGIAVNAFPSALQEAIAKLNDLTIWVLCANSSLERSHVSPKDGQSVFGKFIVGGLAGDADENGDDVISLDELYGYVQPNVSAWVDAATAKNESQTPLLLNCRASEEAAAAVKLLTTSGLSSLGDMAAGLATGEAGADPLSSASEELMSQAPEQAGELLAQRGGEATGSNPAADASASAGQADASGNAEDGQANTAGASSPGHNASNEGLEFRRQAAHELAKAWKAAADLTSSDKTLSPSVYAPSIWRALIDRLLWFEYFCAADFPAKQESIWRPAVDELRSINRSFDVFNNEAEIPTGGNLVDELRRARRLLRPPMQVADAAAPHVSLALLEYAAEQDGRRPLPEKVEKLLKFARAYDLLMLDSENATPDKLNGLLADKEQVDAAELAKFYEFQILDLRNSPDVPWELAGLALRVRRLGEKAAADLYCGQGWGRAAIDLGDRARWEGERLLGDRSDRNWEKLAHDDLVEAQNRYQQAAEELSEVRGADKARTELLNRLPDYFRWAHFSRAEGIENSPKPEKLRNLLAALGESDKVLSKPGNSITDLRRVHRQLEEARALIDQGLQEVSEPWRISAQLLTALPDFQKRGQLRADLAKAAASQMIDFPRQEFNSAVFQTRPVDDRRWLATKSQLEIDLELARQAGFSPPSEKNSQAKDEESKSDASQLLYEMDEMHDGLFDSPIESHNFQAVATASTRPDALVKLRGGIRHWLLHNAHQASSSKPETGNLYSLLNHSAWYDLLVWQSDRFQRALDDAPPDQVRILRNSRDVCRGLANTIQGQPKLAAISESQLALEAPKQIYLDKENEAPVTLSVKSPSPTEVLLIAEYDSRILSVVGRGIISQEKLREGAELANRTNRTSQPVMYPYRPDVPRAASKMSLSAGVRRDVPLIVRRVSNERGQTKLILKAVSPDDYVRYEVPVTLPSKELFQLTVAAIDGLSDKSNDSVVLHPRPNRLDHFVFNLANRTNVKRTVAVSFFAPAPPPADQPPIEWQSGAMKTEDADKVLNELGGKELVKPITVELPATGEARRIEFTPPADQPTPPAQSNLLITDPAAPDKPPAIDLPNGLVVVIEDKQANQKTLRRVEIQPQPPRHYLSARANINSAGLLTITVTATNRLLVPPEGIKLSAAFTGISEQLDSTREATLRAPTYEATLSGMVPPNAPDELNVTIDVDNYPRAFIFQISRQTNSVEVPVTYAMDVRMEVQGPKRAFKAPDDKVPVTVKVDAPYDTFGERSGAYVEVGIDSDQDRLLADAGEKQWTLRSDRQVNVAATNFALNGTLTLDTRISDFSLDLTTNARTRPVWVLSRLWAPPLEPKTSEPIEIKLDGAPPKIEEIRLPGSQIEAGKDLEITVFASDLSGVAKVESIFETLSSGNAQGVKPAWEVAQPNNEGGWLATLKTDKLLRGTRHQVLVKATDEVGHVSEGRSDEVQVVDKPGEGSLTREQLNQRKFVDVKGEVLFKRQALKSVVKFDPPLAPAIGPVETDDGGNFTLRRVPVGKHTLKARGRGGAYYRNAELVIEVTKDSENPLSVTLEAK